MNREPLVARCRNGPIQAPLKKGGGLVSRQGLKRAVSIDDEFSLPLEPPPEIQGLADPYVKISKIGFNLIRVVGVKYMDGAGHVRKA